MNIQSVVVIFYHSVKQPSKSLGHSVNEVTHGTAQIIWNLKELLLSRTGLAKLWVFFPGSLLLIRKAKPYTVDVFSLYGMATALLRGWNGRLSQTLYSFFMQEIRKTICV